MDNTIIEIERHSKQENMSEMQFAIYVEREDARLAELCRNVASAHLARVEYIRSRRDER